MNLYNFLLLLFAVLQIGDYATTQLVLKKRGGFNPSRESNPALRWLMQEIGEHWGFAKLLVASVILTVLWCVGSSEISLGVVCILLGAYGWVVLHNWREYRS